ncbi:class I adenylate-forming enzyme family protein [Frankia gtarii]|uniref:class I adenylate-forming enzyme family protein n=1 Tax=Frankia gtarii TaxID=2950102 RepID=UPI0021BF5D7C|nr:fatty acid--CoA ligase family protein [Frankia gtarii]
MPDPDVGAGVGAGTGAGVDVGLGVGLGVGWLERVLAVHAGSARPAVLDAGGPVSGAELVGRATYAAEFLTGLGVAAGTPVPALLTSNPDALALLLGGAAADRPVAPLGPRLTAAELAGPVRAAGAGVLLTEPAWAAVATEAAALAGARVVPVPALRASGAAPPGPGGPVALYLHTSGTTGAAKRVPVTQEVLAARTELLSGLLELGPDSRHATGSPLHHIGGLGNTLVAVTVGATVLPTSRFSHQWWAGLREQGATHCQLVPTMIEMLLAEGTLDAVPLRTLIYGASPISPETLRRVQAVLPGVRLVNLFGQTEGSPLTCLTPADHDRAAAGAPDLLTTVGRPVPGLRLRIADPDDAGVGEVFAAAAHLSVHAADGWLHSGDLGFLDDDGYLHLVGRRNDMIVRGGENVYPLEIEHTLVEHPGVADAGIVGVPDARLGETLAAFVVPADPDRPPTADELRSFVRDRLAGFKVPAYWYVVDALPLNAAGKLTRPALRARHDAAAAQTAAAQTAASSSP